MLLYAAMAFIIFCINVLTGHLYACRTNSFSLTWPHQLLSLSQSQGGFCQCCLCKSSLTQVMLWWKMQTMMMLRACPP